jgi:hypothetical protein
MKIIRKIVLPVLVCCGISVLVVSCKDENIEKSNSVEKVKDFSASKRLAAMTEKVNPSDEDINEYVEGFKKLSFDESIEFRRLQHEKIKAEVGNKTNVIESLEKDMEWFTKINKQSMELFGKPVNQISGLQMDKVFSAYDAKNSKNAKIAACPVVGFNAGFTRGVGGSTNLSITSIREVAQPSSPNDCDCQIAFATTNTNFRKLKPANFAASTLLNLFSNSLGGRQFSGAGAGTYPVFGQNRVKIAYPQAVFIGCSALSGQYTLSNN